MNSVIIIEYLMLNVKPSAPVSAVRTPEDELKYWKRGRDCERVDIDNLQIISWALNLFS